MIKLFFHLCRFAKYLKLLIDEMTDKVELPKTTFPKTTLLTEKIKTLSNYVVWIKIKN